MPIRIGLVGAGKIAVTQHVPAIASDPDFALAAIADPRGGTADYPGLEEMLAGSPDIDAIVLCTPPQIRFPLARTALQAGKHVLLEKPPCATLAELDELADLAQRQRLTLFTAWHSRYAPAVAVAKTWLTTRAPAEVRIAWKEDVRVWHPGQDWIWEAGGLGVFDAGINALSILTAILPAPFALRGGELRYPQNRNAPIAASLDFTGEGGVPISVEFDWTVQGGELWDIIICTEEAATLRLSKGGACLDIDGKPVALGPEAEYPSLYAEFSRLIAGRHSGVDGRPLHHVAEAFRLGKRVGVEPFFES